MKICFFIGNISANGGTERVTVAIANYLVEHDYEVTILSYRNGISASFVCDENIQLHSLHLENITDYLGRKIKPYTRLIKYFSKNNFDLIINVDVILCLYTLPIRKILKRKLLAWEHFNCRSNNGAKNRDFARMLAGRVSDGIIVLTQADKDEYIKKINLKCPVIVINNPITYKKRETLYNKEKNIAIAVGRLTYQKNLQELISIWHSLGIGTKDWILKIIGTGEDEDCLKSMVSNLNISNIEFIGFSNNPDIYYQESKIMLMTSRYEGLPMVLLEAQENGVPIIAYDCFTGPSEIIIDKQNGFLIPYGDKVKFAEKLQHIIDNSNLVCEMSRNAYLDSRRFMIDKIGKEWIELLEKIVTR